MEDTNEEFEPLFDYTRVQPRDIVCLDGQLSYAFVNVCFKVFVVLSDVMETLDDSEDASPVVFSKRRKISDTETAKKVVDVDVEDAKVVNVEDTEDKEEDWLPPPPKILNNSNKILKEDSTLKALRLKKQELASFAQSAEELVQAVEESVRKNLHSSSQYSPRSATKETVEPPPERKKLVISIQDKDGLKQFRVYMDDKLERLFKMYADRIKLDVNNLVFSFDGDKISSTATPDSLGMEENDIIEVHVKSS
ncbi:hypothetical protein F511_17705 [Dorcoceras hygrometricum]|uniref:Rad60/SUMO-like domain-containing protein n=1 Tax=Dorcoceras hygrometricum TaxID=472368 RepID=A0A2Z7BTR2_9LAMI|nr:hypothetical protein F511_17705 [Dorcoceras hygrometricum]